MTQSTKKPPKLTRQQIRDGLDSIPMDSLILGANTGARLTHKQREFARLVALGESKAGAYRKSYNSKGSNKTQANDAYKLSRNPDVSAMTQAFAQAKQFTDSHTPEQLRSFVIQQLAKHAADEDVPPSVRVVALKTLGQVAEVSAFETRAVVTHVKASGDLRDRIAEKLKLIGASTTLEHNAHIDDEQDADSLLAELEGTGFDAQDADPTAPTPPLNEGDFVAEATHIIPHIQISDPHIQSPDDNGIDATVTHSSITPSVISDLEIEHVHDVADGELSYGYSHIGADSTSEYIRDEENAGGQL